MYGDLDVTRESPSAAGPFRILFRPFGQKSDALGAGHVVQSVDDLRAFLGDLGLSNEQVATLSTGLGDTPGRWLRVLAPTAVLKRKGLA